MMINLGQVSGLWIGNYAPENTTLIWFDTGNNIHKIYDYSTGLWIPISMNPIVNKTYAELQNLAAGNNIAQGTFYKITDLGYLALAITSTKIQYTDNNGNFIIDDLIASKTYCVTSSNLLIDNLGGVWDLSTNTLKFNFSETAIDGDSDDDFVFGSKLRNGDQNFSKYKLKNFVSSVANNALSWNRGVYLNFLIKLQSYYNQNGGVVRYETYTNAVNSLAQALNNLQNAVNNLNIWSKQLQSSFNVPSTRSDIAVSDTLKTIIEKIQSWFNSLKFAKGSVLSGDYSQATGDSRPAIGDTVETAISKLDGVSGKLPSNWTESNTNSDPTVVAGESYSSAIGKIQRWFSLFWHITNEKFFSRDADSLFEFNLTDRTLKVGDSNKKTEIKSGEIKSVVTSSELQLPNTPSSELIEKKFNEFDGKYTSVFNPYSGNKNVTLNLYTIHAKEPILPSVSAFGGGVTFSNNEFYAIFGESLFSKIRSSEVQMIDDSYIYDTERGLLLTQAFEINRNTPEFIIMQKKSGNVNTIYLMITIGSLREGQVINLIHKSAAGVNNWSVALESNVSGNGIMLKSNMNIETGDVSLTFPTNTGLKFVAVNASRFGGNGMCLVEL